MGDRLHNLQNSENHGPRNRYSCGENESKRNMADMCRETDYFPVREVTFRCTDDDISYEPGQQTFSSFAYTADIPYEAVVIIAFCLPPFVVSILVGRMT